MMDNNAKTKTKTKTGPKSVKVSPKVRAALKGDAVRMAKPGVVPGAVLRAAVGLLKRHVAEPKSTMPALESMMVEASLGLLTFTATDLDVQACVTVPYTGPSFEPRLVAVAGTHKILSAVKGDTVVVQPDAETGGLRIEASGRAFRLPKTYAAEDFPLVETVPPGGIETEMTAYDTDRLVTALEFVLPAVSTDETRYNMGGVCFEDALLVSTDTHRLHIARLASGEAVSRSGILRAKGANALLAAIRAAKDPEVKLLRKKTLAIGEVGEPTEADVFWFSVRDRMPSGLDVKLAVIGVKGQFPPHKHVTPRPESWPYDDKDVVRLRAQSSTFIAALKLAATVHDGLTKTAIVTARDQATEIEACQYEAPPAGGIAGPTLEYSEVLSDVWVESGEGARFGFNARYMIDAAALGGEIQIEARDADGSALLVTTKAPDRAGWLAVIMPIRV